MFTRRLAQRATTLAPTTSTAAAAVRPFSSTQWALGDKTREKSPALADVTPDNAHVFDQRTQEFRKEQAARVRREREQHESQSASAKASAEAKQSSSPNTASSSSSIAGSSNDPNSQAAEKQSPSTAAAENDPKQKKVGSGPLSKLIYGTEEGRKMDQDIERSFSQVLARGKYVHSIVFHEVKPGKVDEYVELVGSWYPRMANMPENKVNLVGSWRTEVGDCDTFVHIWEYQRYAGYHQSLNAIQNHPEFAEFDRKLKKLIRTKRTSLMQEFSFWPTTSPRKLGGVFELRTYTLHPGNLLEWEHHWRKGLEARKEVMEGVGAWFVQIGALNEVHHLWQFPDLEERRARREQSWSVPGWAETVHRTVPLIQEMKSSIMVPMPWSPVG
ncbi:hypothetical protein Q7P37_006544 [Cladosporium fusiforme]